VVVKRGRASFFAKPGLSALILSLVKSERPVEPPASRQMPQEPRGMSREQLNVIAFTDDAAF
jgi:hypothetical protein